MAETILRKEEQKAVDVRLPTIRREERELHSPIDAMGRGAAHLRTPAELTRPGGERALARADFDMRVARNVSGLRLEGSTPLPERFRRVLDSI